MDAAQTDPCPSVAKAMEAVTDVKTLPKSAQKALVTLAEALCGVEKQHKEDTRELWAYLHELKRRHHDAARPGHSQR